VTVGGDQHALAELGLANIDDRWPGEGPLGGLIAGLEHVQHDLACYAPCDLVTPDAKSFALLIAALDAAPSAGLALPEVDGVQRPAPAALRVSKVAAAL